MPFCHTFYELDGRQCACVLPDGAAARRGVPDRTSNRYDHIALNADDDELEAICDRLRAEGVEFFVQDHGYVKSLYVVSPMA